MKKFIFLVVLVFSLVIAWTKVLDTTAKDYNFQTSKDVITTLAITRSINATLSVVQNSSLLLGVGVQAELAIGEIVNPINDFLDRFSWILLFALVSLGIQDLIIALGQTLVINSLFSIGVFLSVFSIFKENKFKSYIYKLTIFLFFIRFAVPVITILDGYIYHTMMYQQIITIQENNKKFDTEINSLLPTNNSDLKNLQYKLNVLEKEKDFILDNATKNLSYFEKLKVKLNYNNGTISQNDIVKLNNIEQKIKTIKLKIDKLDINPIDKIDILIKKVKHNMDNFFTQSYTTIILFLSRGVVFPLLFFWIFIRLWQNILKDENELFIKNG